MKTLLEVVTEANENFMVTVKLGGSGVIKKAMERYIEKIAIFLEEKNGKEFMSKYQEKISGLKNKITNLSTQQVKNMNSLLKGQSSKTLNRLLERYISSVNEDKLLGTFFSSLDLIIASSTTPALGNLLNFIGEKKESNKKRVVKFR